MEFFAIVDRSSSEQELQERLRLDRLAHYCDFIEDVVVRDETAGDMFSLWGRFPVSRELIKGGVRFTLPTCPNALAWTVTTGFPPAPQAIVLHCTINRTEHDPDFIDSLKSFVSAWQKGLTERWEGEPNAQPQRAAFPILA